jgi:hypothetical protein
MTPMSNFAMGSYVVALASVLRGSTIIHLGKFQKEEYLSNILKHKASIRFFVFYIIEVNIIKKIYLARKLFDVPVCGHLVCEVRRS